ncbi:GroES-like protein [Mollisia scopiformis]|uniref:GroES-like protein n=1 Tax=Mollisia scopiformis TaxID=149040 RepID=A0A132B3E6_MOLSC|nr:GroES-like protein [Mollisia scopiformis]KUJ06444.1 GroES-like protein [Mollisia scopiformis]
MSTRPAIVQRNNALVRESLPMPKLEERQVLVKVFNSSLNPTDVQSFDGDAFGDGAVLGCDFAGVVEEVGPSVTQLKVGDKIAALIWGGEIEGLGAYSTYCVADERIAFKIPSGLDYATANSGTSLLVWGGSSTVGAYTIQIAAMHGFNIVTTCSTRNFDVVKKHGAKHVFDYNDPDVVAKIAEAAPDLAYAFDCIGNSISSVMSARAMGDKKGGVICTVRPGKAFTEDVPSNVTVTDVLVFTAFLKPHTYKKIYHWPTHQEDHELSREMYSKIRGWIQEGKLTPQKPRDMGTLSVETLQRGMDLNRKGEVSNEKLCFQVSSM